MNFCNSNIVLEESYTSPEMKNNLEVSDMSGAVSSGKNFIIDTCLEDDTAKAHSVIEERNNEESDGMYSPLTDDEIVNTFDETMVESKLSPRKLQKELLPNETFENDDSNVDTRVVKRMNMSEETNEINSSVHKTLPKVNDNGNSELKEVSVQTVEDKLSMSNVVCPVCSLEKDDLNNIVTAFCLQYPFMKGKVLEVEKDTLNRIVEGRKKEVLSHVQVQQQSPSLIQDNIGGSTSVRESSTRTIRLGLSRKVKFPPLHPMCHAKKTELTESH